MTRELINAAVEVVRAAQHPNGCFESVSSVVHDDFSHAEKHATTFFTSCIALALHGTTSSVAQEIVGSAVRFLLQEKSNHWSFNYWLRTGVENAANPYPDDLDDTVLALAVLTLYRPEVMSGETLASVAQVLTSVESAEGGPYYTWIVPADVSNKWRDIDPAVNCNAAYFLQVNDVRLPALDAYLNELVVTRSFHSPYYVGEIPVLYFLARAYQGARREELLGYILSKPQFAPTRLNPLMLSMLITTFVRLGAPREVVERYQTALVGMDKHILWRPYSLVAEHVTKVGQPFAGSEALTAACVIEALLSANSTKVSVVHAADSQSEVLFKKIKTAIHDRLSVYDESLRLKVENVVEQVLEHDSGRHVPLVSFFVARDLGIDVKCDSELYVLLGVANVFGWVAYTVYDDFFDEEGKPSLLPVANVCLQELAATYAGLGQTNPLIGQMFRKVMGKLEGANYWETSQSRAVCEGGNITITNLPKYGYHEKLAARSFGHALGPLCVSITAQGEKDSEYRAVLETFFTQYLIAKQLNDDLHDWEDDLSRGHMTAVVSRLLARYAHKYSLTLPFVFSTKTMLSQAQELFWHEAVTDEIHIVREHLRVARTALERLGVDLTQSYCAKLLAPLARAMDTVEVERKKTVDFLKTFAA